MNEKFAIILAVCILIGLAFVIQKTWTLGDDESDYGIVCLGGHEYWRANFAAKGFLGIKLERNGKPVPCE